MKYIFIKDAKQIAEMIYHTAINLFKDDFVLIEEKKYLIESVTLDIENNTLIYNLI